MGGGGRGLGGGGGGLGGGGDGLLANGGGGGGLDAGPEPPDPNCMLSDYSSFKVHTYML